MHTTMMFTVALTSIAAVIDARSREIPDWISLALLGVGVAACVFGLDAIPWQHRALGAIAGFGIGALAFYAGAFGGGDAKLAAGIGAAIGLPRLIPVLLFTAIVGGVLAFVAQRRGQREVAYGPAFLIGLLVFCGIEAFETRGGG